MEFDFAIAAWCEKAKGNADQVVRAVALEAFTRIVMRSPVGNPDNWLSLRPYTDLRTGRVRTARKPPAGYVGGTLRRSWHVAVGVPVVEKRDGVDPTGTTTIAEAEAKLAGVSAGPSIWLTSNAPHALACEFGHSAQAPAGMVRVTAAEMTAIADQAVRNLSNR